ncbi:hypothetical protein BCEP4_500049 [Burkholderia cepacia]|nr:hypothetical protein BCEP4_500049 [Burkholderia cepacia]
MHASRMERRLDIEAHGGCRRARRRIVRRPIHAGGAVRSVTQPAAAISKHEGTLRAPQDKMNPFLPASSDGRAPLSDLGVAPRARVCDGGRPLRFACPRASVLHRWRRHHD